MTSTDRLQRNDKILQSFENYLSTVENIEEFVGHVKFLGFYLANNPASSLYSELIDQQIKKFQVSLGGSDTRQTNGKTLHVATQIYLTGGHTRVIQNWINFSKDRTHDLVLVEQYRKYKLNIPKTSKIIELAHDLSATAKVICLNELYAEYDEVIFHIHPHDVIPLIAMGSMALEKFKFYNHADHIFTIGPSLVSLVYDMSSKGSLFSLNFRGARASQVIPFPLDVRSNLLSEDQRATKKKNLQLPTHSKVILTVGAEYKYIPNLEFNLFSRFAEIANKNSELHFIFIGPDASFEKYCGQAVPSNLKIIGKVSPQTVHEYYGASDLYVDSLPIGGGLSLIEASLFGLPILTFENGFNSFDAVEKFKVSYDQLEAIIKKTLHDTSYRNSVTIEGFEEASKHQKENWLKNFQNPIQKLSSSNRLNHKVLEDYCNNLSEKYTTLTLPRLSYKLSNTIIVSLFRYLPKRFVVKVILFQHLTPLIFPNVIKLLDRELKK